MTRWTDYGHMQQITACVRQSTMITIDGCRAGQITLDSLLTLAERQIEHEVLRAEQAAEMSGKLCRAAFSCRFSNALLRVLQRTDTIGSENTPLATVEQQSNATQLSQYMTCFKRTVSFTFLSASRAFCLSPVDESSPSVFVEIVLLTFR